MNRIRSFFRYSLGRRLALYFTLMMLLPLSAAGMTVYRASDMRMNNSALQLSAQIVSNVALDLDQLLTDAKSMIDLVIRDDTIQHHINRVFNSENNTEDVQISLNLRLKQLGEYYKNIYGVYLILDNGMVAKSRYYSIHEELELPADFYRQARNHSDVKWRLCPTGSMIVNNMGAGVLSAAASLTDKSTGLPCGIIIVDIRLETIRKMVNVYLGENGNVFLMDRSGNVLMEQMEDDGQRETVSEFIRGTVIGEETEIHDNAHFFILSSRLPESGWTLTGLVHKNFIRQNSRQILKILLWIALIACLINLLVSRLLRAYELRPIHSMMQFVGQVEKGDFDTPLFVVRDDEIGALAVSMKKMTLHIKELLHTVRQEQERLRWAEFKALQAQINPHFLYNTLDSVKWLIWEGENKKADDMVTALTKFFRIGLSGGCDLIPVECEIAHVESYLKIQKIRYSREFEYTVYLDHSISGCMVPKLILQPLVENALYHGIKPARRKCRLFINALQQEDTILLEVRDDGVGIPQNQLQQLGKLLKYGRKYPSESYGLGNICDRIHILAGEEYGIEIVSELGIGTSVRLHLPLKLGGNENVSSTARR